MIERIKLRLFLLVLFVSSFSALSAQDQRLMAADSLFEAQKYTEALTAYELLYNEGLTSTSMLLRMAYIQDGLGNYTEALIYLDQYYRFSADRQAVGKIQELAEENELTGYSYSDLTYFKSLLVKNRVLIIILLGGVSALLFVVILRTRNRERNQLVPAFLQMVSLLLLFFVVNFSNAHEGVIISDGTLLRSGPSAGAESIDFLSKGHKVEVLEVGPVWTKIQWEGKEGFIRNSRMRSIS